MTSKQSFELRFTDVLERALLLGLTEEQMMNMAAVKQLQLMSNEKQSKMLTTYILSSLVLLVVVLLAIFFGLPAWSSFHSKLAARTDEKCLSRYVENVKEHIFHPPIDCTFCLDILTWDRRSRITSSTFESLYAYSGRPLVVSGAVHHWPALRTFSYELFERLYADGKADHCQFLEYGTSFETLSRFFNISKDLDSPWYVGFEDCVPATVRRLRRHYSPPPFLPDRSEPGPVDWVFMGSPGYGAHAHIDNLPGRQSWQAQVRGKKYWRLRPPPECYYRCPGHLSAILVPGDVIAFDSNRWVHETRVVGKDVSIVVGQEFD